MRTKSATLALTTFNKATFGNLPPLFAIIYTLLSGSSGVRKSGVECVLPDMRKGETNVA